MPQYHIPHHFGCGVYEVTADNAEAAIAEARSWLTPDEGNYEMYAIPVMKFEIVGGNYGPERILFDTIEEAEESAEHLKAEYPHVEWQIVKVAQ